MAVLEDLEEAERYLLALLQDQSAIDIAEFLWTDETSPDSVFRCYDYQYPWYRTSEKFQLDLCGRSLGKSLGIQMRAFAFPFTNAGEEMLITAPELIHLEPVTREVENRLLSKRITRELLATDRATQGIKKRPFEARFRNGSRIVGRIPQKDGRGVKGMHPKKLELDEAQDFPLAGWTELFETLKFGNEDATWRAHGVSRGLRDEYFRHSTNPESPFFIHKYTAMHRPDWSDAERENKIVLYGGRNSPDYRRNILGAHGDAENPMFVLHRLMSCVDINKDSDYNQREYHYIRISDEKLRETHMSIETVMDLPEIHRSRYDRFWIGVDVGMTNHPTEILVFAEDPTHSQSARKDRANVFFRMIARFNLRRISAPVQRAALKALFDFYHPQAIAMDSTGLGLPIYSEIINGPDKAFATRVIGYNFASKITVGYEVNEDEDAEWWEVTEPEPIMANVLEFSSDVLRRLVDDDELRLPWDEELLREFQGQTYRTVKSSVNPYGKKIFNEGSFHALDAARVAALAYVQDKLSATLQRTEDRFEAVLDGWA